MLIMCIAYTGKQKEKDKRVLLLYEWGKRKSTVDYTQEEQEGWEVGDCELQTEQMAFQSMTNEEERLCSVTEEQGASLC